MDGIFLRLKRKERSWIVKGWEGVLIMIISIIYFFKSSRSEKEGEGEGGETERADRNERGEKMDYSDKS